MILRKIVFVTLVLMTVLSGCKKKEGCTDVNALNHDTSAEKDDGSCTFPKQVIINYVKVVSHPNVNPQGQPWTSGGQNPDYFIQIKNIGIAYQSEEKPQALLPVTFDMSTLVKFEISSHLMVHLFIGDNGQFAERNILPITLADYPTYPKTISRSNEGYTYEIGVTWE